MRAFLTKCVFFLAPILLTFGLAEISLRRLPTSYKIKDAQLAANAKNINLLILGNSHATYDLDPQLFSLNAFNAASVNQSFYFDKRITLKYLPALTNLKFVLLSVDFHSLYFSSEGLRDLWSYYGYGINYRDSLSALQRNCYLYGYRAPVALEFLWRPFERKYSVIRSVDVDPDVDLQHPYTKGYVGLVGGPHLSDSSIRVRVEYFDDIVRSSTERATVLADLESFIDTLRQRNVMPILITLPCYAPFGKLLDTNVIARNKTDILAICDRWHIPYWDFFSMPLDRDCFYDPNHLNEKGAAIVTSEVNRLVTAMR